MVTKENNRYSDKNDKVGDNRVKNDWSRGGGMNIPSRLRRPEDQSATAGLMMEVWASVASWFLKPDGSNPLSTNCSSSNSVTNSIANDSNKNNNYRITSDLPLPFGPTICTAIRCTVPGCNCECFTPGKLHIRYCESCSHGWVPHALDKLGFRHIFGQAPVEAVQPNIAFDIASLVLYGCQALPIRLKILLDRLFSVLQKDEVTQILRGFGWTHEDYVRGYILQEAHGTVLDRWNICSPEEEPLVLQQFLRFGETRTITQQLLLHGLGDLRHLPRIEADLKKIVEKNVSKGLPHAKHEENRSKSILNLTSSASKLKNPSSPTNISTSLLPIPPPTHIPGKFPPLHSSLHSSSSGNPPSPQQKNTPLNFVKLPQTGLTCIPITTSNGTINSPSNNVISSSNMSPLNKLQNMQPFDFRKIASGVFPSSKSSSEKRRLSEASDTSQTGLNLCVTSPSTLLPPPPLLVSQSVTSPFPSNTRCKSPAVDFTSKGSSEFGSEDADDDDEHSQSALNLSKDATNLRVPRPRHSHSRKTSTPMKRQWGSSNLPLNLGTQLINPATGKKRVQCNVCLKTFCDKGALKIHFSAVHLREMHKCTVEGCNMMFSSRRSRNRHSANPNPKLHSPHLRRKISPHDGRSAQSHPLLVPPLQAGLNPLTFGTFPLLTPPELRHQLSSLELKQGFDFANSNDNSRFDMSLNKSDDFMDDDDEDGIVVDGAGVDDDENDSETYSVDKADSMKSKQTKMSYSDMEEDGMSNTDSNESMALFDHQQPIKEENDLVCLSKNVHKRKSQKPTRCALRTVVSDDEPLSDEYSNDMIFTSSHSGSTIAKLDQEKEWDLSKAVKLKVKSEAFSNLVNNKNSDFENKITSKVSTNVEEDEYDESKCLNLTKNLQNASIVIKQENPEKIDCRPTYNDKCPSPALNNDFNNEYRKQNSQELYLQKEKIKEEEYIGSQSQNYEHEPINYSTLDVEASSPKRSHDSSAPTSSCDSDENSDSHVFRHFEDGNFINSMDVPLDKDNPRKCTACGKVFQNHFGVKTHFQNVHLKLMHKCEVVGCNAAFPSKRSRDRHSANWNLHQKLLSTTDNPDVPRNEFLSAFFGESPNLSLNCSTVSVASPTTTNGELISSNPSLLIPPFNNLPFSGLNPFTSHLPILNGKSEDKTLPPSKSPCLLTYNVEEDMPSPDQDNIFHCRFCSKPFTEISTLKNHYERHHLNEMYRCKIPGCLQVFSSRTKRNAHSENRLIHEKTIPTS